MFSVTDLPTVYTTFVQDRKRKLISNYGGAGPKSLQAIERLIDGLLAQVLWDAPVELRK